MIASVSLHWAMLVAQFFIIRVFMLSPKVSWVAFVIMILAIAVVYAIRLKHGRWRDPQVLERVMADVETYLSENRSRVIDRVRTFEEQKRRTYAGDIAMVKLLTAVESG